MIKRKAVIIIFCMTGFVMVFSILLVSLVKQKNYNLNSEKQTGKKLVITISEGTARLDKLRTSLSAQSDESIRIACWLEDSAGRFVATIFAVQRFDGREWQVLPFGNSGESGGSYPLPIWAHKHIRGGIFPAESCATCHEKHRGAPQTIGRPSFFDKISFAFRNDSFFGEWSIPAALRNGRYVFCAEINRSSDYNATYRKELAEDNSLYNGSSGQPSLLLQGAVTIGGMEYSTVLQPVGHGHPGGKNGSVYRDLDGITSAGTIFGSIEAGFFPAR